MEPLLQHLGELSDAEAERITQDLLPESRPLGALLLRLRPSRQLRSGGFGVGTCGRFALNHFGRIIGGTFVNFLSRTDT